MDKILGKDGGDEPSSESEDAAKDILSAIKAGDASALDLALQRHYACCDDSSMSDDEPDEDDAADESPSKGAPAARRY